MAALTRWLQSRFAAHCPRGWRCSAEAPLLTEAASIRLGFGARADVLLEREADGRRIWVEFEVSRADPVANHAKFATARFFEHMPADDAFVSMTSRHIVPGRAALAASTAVMMRALGIPAFQVMLLPQIDGIGVKHFNSLPVEELDRLGPDIAPELARVLDITNALELDDGHRIHRADNPWTVSLNVRRWNAEPAHVMTLDVYTRLDEGDPRFDGNLARKHLQLNLGYRAIALSQAPAATRSAFEAWHARVAPAVHLRGQTTVLFPPEFGDSGSRT